MSIRSLFPTDWIINTGAILTSNVVSSTVNLPCDIVAKWKNGYPLLHYANGIVAHSYLQGFVTDAYGAFYADTPAGAGFSMPEEVVAEMSGAIEHLVLARHIPLRYLSFDGRLTCFCCVCHPKGCYGDVLEACLGQSDPRLSMC